MPTSRRGSFNPYKAPRSPRDNIVFARRRGHSVHGVVYELVALSLHAHARARLDLVGVGCGPFISAVDVAPMPDCRALDNYVKLFF